MKRGRYAESQIVFLPRQAETGTAVGEVCRRMGIAEAKFYRQKNRYQGLRVYEIRRLGQWEDENRCLRHLVADLTLDKAVLQDVLRGAA